MPDKPSTNEEEYFLRHEQELMAAHRARLDAERRDRERRAHYMKCPKCGFDLVERPMEHLLVDVCERCHGMWLDGGELEMLRAVDRKRAGSFLGALLHRRH